MRIALFLLLLPIGAHSAFISESPPDLSLEPTVLTYPLSTLKPVTPHPLLYIPQPAPTESAVETSLPVPSTGHPDPTDTETPEEDLHPIVSYPDAELEQIKQFSSESSSGSGSDRKRRSFLTFDDKIKCITRCYEPCRDTIVQFNNGTTQKMFECRQSSKVAKIIKNLSNNRIANVFLLISTFFMISFCLVAVLFCDAKFIRQKSCRSVNKEKAKKEDDQNSKTKEEDDPKSLENGVIEMAHVVEIYEEEWSTPPTSIRRFGGREDAV